MSKANFRNHERPAKLYRSEVGRHNLSQLVWAMYRLFLFVFLTSIRPSNCNAIPRQTSIPRLSGKKKAQVKTSLEAANSMSKFQERGWIHDASLTDYCPDSKVEQSIVLPAG